MSDFVQDLAAICAAHPNMMQRKTSKNAAVSSSLERATTARELGYIQNTCKYVANNANYYVIFGTTRNEAFHKHLKALCRNVARQTQRRALCIATAVKLAKPFIGFLSKCRGDQPHAHAQHDMLAQFSQFLLAEAPFHVVPRIRHAVSERISRPGPAAPQRKDHSLAPSMCDVGIAALSQLERVYSLWMSLYMRTVSLLDLIVYACFVALKNVRNQSR